MRINQAETARDVFHGRGFNTQIAQPQQCKIMAAMQAGRTYTIGELAAMLNMEKSTVSARRNAMLAAGLVELGQERKCSRSGKTCQTIRLPLGQMDLLAA